MKYGRHFAIVAVLIVIGSIVAYVLLESIYALPLAASEEADGIDALFRGHFILISFLFALVVVFLLYSVVVFRRRPDEPEDVEGDHFHGHTGLEIVWTIIPLMLVVVFGVWGARLLTDIIAPDEDEITINVVGQQWSWRFEYPEHGDITSDELVLPVHQPVRLEMTSIDVLHSFWVPEFRLKQDAVPGRWTELRVKPTETGDYRLRCAELCGYAHAAMISRVVVVEPAAFEAWLQGMSVAQPTGDDTSPAGRGAMMVQDNGCTSCHSVDGTTLVGPSWQGVFGSERQLEDGSTVTADEEYLRRAILDPGSQVVAGFPNVMPAAYNFLPEEDITAMVEYIKTLSR